MASLIKQPGDKGNQVNTDNIIRDINESKKNQDSLFDNGNTIQARPREDGVSGGTATNQLGQQQQQQDNAAEIARQQSEAKRRADEKARQAATTKREANQAQTPSTTPPTMDASLETLATMDSGLNPMVVDAQGNTVPTSDAVGSQIDSIKAQNPNAIPIPYDNSLIDINTGEVYGSSKKQVKPPTRNERRLSSNPRLDLGNLAAQNAQDREQSIDRFIQQESAAQGFGPPETLANPNTLVDPNQLEINNQDYAQFAENVAPTPNVSGGNIDNILSDLVERAEKESDAGTQRNAEAERQVAQTQENTGKINERDLSGYEDAITRIQAELEYGSVRTSGETLDDQGKVVYSQSVQAAIDRWRKYFATQDSDAAMWTDLRKYLNFFSDTMEETFNIDSDYAVLDDKIVVSALQEMIANHRQYGHPLAYTNRAKKFAGVYRFPVSIYDQRSLKLYTTDRPGFVSKMTPSQMYQTGVAQWIDEVRPALDANGTSTQKYSTRYVADALERQLGTNENYAGWTDATSPHTRMTIQEAFDPEVTYVNAFGQTAMYNSLFQERQRKLEQAIELHHKKTHKIKKDKDGNIISATEIKRNMLSFGLKTFLNGVKALQLMTNPVLAAYSIMEGLYANAQLGMTTRWLYKVSTTSDGSKPELPSQKMVERSRGSDTKKAMQELFRIFSGPNREELEIQSQEGVRFGSDNRSFTEKVKQADGRGKVAVITETMMNVGSAIAEGSVVWSANDTKNFIDFFSLEVQRETDLTSKDIETMYLADPVGFVSWAVGTNMGKNALKFAMERTPNAPNVATELLGRLCARSGLTEGAFMTFMSAFWRYPINVTGKLLPFTNTAVYLATHGFAETTGKDHYNDIVIGGNYENDIGKFSKQALMTNLMLDSVRFGMNAVTVSLLYLVTQALGGMDEPDDPEKLNLYEEWVLNGETIQLGWGWLDLFGLITPTVVALNAVKKGHSIETAWNIARTGYGQNLGNHPIADFVDLADMFTHFDDNMVAAQEDHYKQWGDEAPSDIERLAINSGTFMTRRIFNMVTPWFAKAAYTDGGTMSQTDLAPSSSMIYDGGEDKEGNATTTRTTYRDAQWRKVAHKEPLFAAVMNFVQGVNSDNEGETRTGYFRSEAPLVTYSDVAQASWYNMFEITDEMIADPSAEVEVNGQMKSINSVIEEVKLYLTTYDSDKLNAMSFVLPYDARKWTAAYISNERSRLKQERDAALTSPDLGTTWAERDAAKSQIWSDFNAADSYYYNLNTLLWSDSIPYSATKYNQWVGDWKYNPETDEWYHFGNHKSSFAPLTTVDKRYNAYDAQTPVAWQNALTDTDELETWLSGRTAQGGVFDGQDVWDVVSGGGLALQDSDTYDPQLVTGQRALVPSENNRKVTKPTQEEIDAFASILNPDYKTDEELEAEKNSSSSSGGGGSGYSSYRSGGGGGSSYSPNIYSRPANSLNANKPATMYAKNPTYAKFDYLNPKVETKGSREAYKRQDI